MGIVFQFFQLLPTLTVAENIARPMDFCKTFPARERRARALALLEQVGIAEQADKLPADLSGGQQQRAAIARALANDPSILVADEPTGNLDSQTSEAVMQLFAALAALGESNTLHILKIIVREQPNNIAAIEATASSLAAWLKTHGRAVDEIRIPPPGKHPHATQLNAVLMILLAFSLMALALSAILTATILTST